LYRARVSEEPHSAAYFGPQRDFWWNPDHLRLIGARRRLGRVHNVLDVGSGVGHWGRLIATLVAPGAAITGVEREPEWVAQATRSAPHERFRYVEGDATALPFDDDTFELVTCQTVLIHVADPQAVIREFVRVTKPGGQVIVAEPNNRASFVIGSSAPPADLLDVLAFVLACERGKAALGEGDNSIGDLVPGFFAQAGLTDVETWMADRPATMVAPYAGDDQQAQVAMLRDDGLETLWGWTREQAERYFDAGGGTDFDAAWDRRRAEARSVAAAIEAGTYHSAGGQLLYLVAGRA
jgi:SAM-dependent methyltransferase